MPSTTVRVAHLILEQLAHGERRVLSLVLAVGKALERTGMVKGDLRATVDSALSALVESNRVVRVEGVYSLAAGKRTARTYVSADRRRVAPAAARDSREPVKSREDRNKTATRKDAVRVEQYLTEIERAHGTARAWALRERLERGEVTLEQLGGR